MMFVCIRTRASKSMQNTEAEKYTDRIFLQTMPVVNNHLLVQVIIHWIRRSLQPDLQVVGTKMETAANNRERA